MGMVRPAMMLSLRLITAATALVGGWGTAAAAAVVELPTLMVDFEDLAVPANPGYLNGSTVSGSFGSRGASFANSYNATFGSWSGWSISRLGDTTTAGFGNQYSSFAGGAASGTNFGVAYVGGDSGRIALPEGYFPVSLQVTNATYAALSMRDGDAFAKKFGGPNGTDPDFFLLTIQGWNAANASTGTIPFYLADFRATESAGDYIVNTWQTVDLSSLGAGTTALTFALSSTDNGVFGMNTPATFAMDNLVLQIPEPSAVVLLAGASLALLWFQRRRR